VQKSSVTTYAVIDLTIDKRKLALSKENQLLIMEMKSAIKEPG
jgi:hypothetical protein